MGKKDKKTKNKNEFKRKVILLKYKDRRESLILSKTVKRKNENLTTNVDCNTEISKSVSDKTTEEYPIFKEQLRERVVPCCFRAKCTEIKLHKKNKKYKHRETKHRKKDRMLRTCEVALSPVSSIFEISDECNSNFSTDGDEIETLIKSTRKRMKDLDNNWKILPRNTSSPLSNKSEGINSLETLVLEADEQHLQNHDYSKEAPTINLKT